MIKVRADLKCYMCGRIVGELEGVASRPPRFVGFRPAAGMESLVGQPLAGARCPACTGALFVEEIERIYLLSERPLKPEKRGRKPKKRSAAA